MKFISKPEGADFIFSYTDRMKNDRNVYDGNGYLIVANAYNNRFVLMDATYNQFVEWHTGALVQVAFPNLSSDEREWLMTGDAIFFK